MIEMLYSTGCRVTELERLDIADVDFEQKEVQQILGHVNINTTMVYAQVSRANVKRDHRRCIV